MQILSHALNKNTRNKHGLCFVMTFIAPVFQSASISYAVIKKTKVIIKIKIKKTKYCNDERFVHIKQFHWKINDA